MRWLLFIPLGLYEITLLLISFALTFLPMSIRLRLLILRIYNHARKLPGIAWYKGE